MTAIKSLGEILFEPGLWVYVGSAMGSGSTSLENRLGRHFRKEKTIYWHIDYLLDSDAKIIEAIWAESTEGEGSTFVFTLPLSNESGREKGV